MEILRNEHPEIVSFSRLGQMVEAIESEVHSLIVESGPLSHKNATKQFLNNDNYYPFQFEVFGKRWHGSVDLRRYSKITQNGKGAWYIGLSFHLSNDGFLYLPEDLHKVSENCKGSYSSHYSKLHKSGIEGYWKLDVVSYQEEIAPMAALASDWLQTKDIAARIEYNPTERRTDIDFLDHKSKLAVSFAFEPGYPIEDIVGFDETDDLPSSFFDYLETKKKEIAAKKEEKEKKIEEGKIEEASAIKISWFDV